MKKPTPEDLQLWKTHVRDVAPLPKVKITHLDLPPQQKFSPRKIEKNQGQKQNYAPPSSPVVPMNRKTLRRIKIDACLDMHGHTLDSGYKLLEKFLLKAQDKGFRTLLIITGKGALNQENTLRHQVPRWLQDTVLRRFVVSLHHPAKPQDGGTGAYYVEVKRKG